MQLSLPPHNQQWLSRCTEQVEEFTSPRPGIDLAAIRQQRDLATVTERIVKANTELRAKNGKYVPYFLY